MLFTWMCRTMFPELSSAHSNSSSTLPNSEESWSLWSSGCRELRIDFQKDPILLCSSCARTDHDATSEACYRPNLKLPDSPTVRNYPVKIYPEKIMFKRIVTIIISKMIKINDSLQENCFLSQINDNLSIMWFKIIVI